MFKFAIKGPSNIDICLETRFKLSDFELDYPLSSYTTDDIIPDFVIPDITFHKQDNDKYIHKP